MADGSHADQVFRMDPCWVDGKYGSGWQALQGTIKVRCVGCGRIAGYHP